MRTGESLVFESHDFRQKVEITSRVFTTFSKFRQKRFWHREAGGQLFAKLENDSTVVIDDVTVPSRWDKRLRYLFVPNRIQEQHDINSRFVHGLHYVGDWHTHPESIPTPSAVDLASIAECFEKSDHELFRFLLVIVGTSAFPDGISVTAHKRSGFESLFPSRNQC